MNRFYRTGISAAIAILTLVSAATAQQANLNLEGVVRDSATGNPVGCKLHIHSPSKKRISITSNSKDGSYLQTLSEAGPHRIVIAGQNVYTKEVIIDIPKSERFRVIKQDITVREIVEGRLLSSIQKGFEFNQPTLTAEGRKAVVDVADVLKANKAMNVVITLTPDEERLSGLRAAAQAEYRKQHDAWTKAVKKVKKGQTPPAEPAMPADPADPNIELMKSREAAITEMMKDVKGADVRVTFSVKSLAAPAPDVVVEPVQAASGKKGKKAAPAPPPAKAKPTVSTEPNLVITIGKVRSLYD
ncbi:MAG: hypothetical protein FGM32_05585 [Candidatus Kapabacteria bacterium]|nr:hypothetical protein [Candidatus Kapabacteria bacterium]